MQSVSDVFMIFGSVASRHKNSRRVRCTTCHFFCALQAPVAASGFLIIVHKWLTVIRLLLGDMPGQSELTSPGINIPLRPYLALASAVRSGDVTAFNSVAVKNADVFLADQTHNLINRLRYNVLRAGLRRISLAYSRISLQVRRSLQCLFEHVDVNTTMCHANSIFMIDMRNTRKIFWW